MKRIIACFIILSLTSFTLTVCAINDEIESAYDSGYDYGYIDGKDASYQEGYNGWDGHCPTVQEYHSAISSLVDFWSYFFESRFCE